MKAGETHPKNYYAWQHARQVFRLLFDKSIYTDRMTVRVESTRDPNDVQEDLMTIHQWCLMHPTDISGWAFLASQLLKLSDGVSYEQEATRIIVKTRAFVDKYDWTGESVKWFLHYTGGTNTLE